MLPTVMNVNTQGITRFLDLQRMKAELLVEIGIARNTNVQPHPVAACRVGWLTLVPGGGAIVLLERVGEAHRISRARVRRAVIAPGWVDSDGD